MRWRSSFCLGRTTYSCFLRYSSSFCFRIRRSHGIWRNMSYLIRCLGYWSRCCRIRWCLEMSTDVWRCFISYFSSFANSTWWSPLEKKTFSTCSGTSEWPKSSQTPPSTGGYPNNKKPIFLWIKSFSQRSISTSCVSWSSCARLICKTCFSRGWLGCWTKIAIITWV